MNKIDLKDMILVKQLEVHKEIQKTDVNMITSPYIKDLLEIEERLFIWLKYLENAE